MKSDSLHWVLCNLHQFELYSFFGHSFLLLLIMGDLLLQVKVLLQNQVILYLHFLLSFDPLCNGIKFFATFSIKLLPTCYQFFECPVFHEILFRGIPSFNWLRNFSFEVIFFFFEDHLFLLNWKLVQIWLRWLLTMNSCFEVLQFSLQLQILLCYIF